MYIHISMTCPYMDGLGDTFRLQRSGRWSRVVPGPPVDGGRRR